MNNIDATTDLSFAQYKNLRKTGIPLLVKTISGATISFDFVNVRRILWNSERILDLNPVLTKIMSPPLLINKVIMENLGGVKNVKDALWEVTIVPHLLDNQLQLIGLIQEIKNLMRKPQCLSVFQSRNLSLSPNPRLSVSSPEPVSDWSLWYDDNDDQIGYWATWMIIIVVIRDVLREKNGIMWEKFPIPTA